MFLSLPRSEIKPVTAQQTLSQRKVSKLKLKRQCWSEKTDLLRHLLFSYLSVFELQIQLTKLSNDYWLMNKARQRHWCCTMRSVSVFISTKPDLTRCIFSRDKRVMRYTINLLPVSITALAIKKPTPHLPLPFYTFTWMEVVVRHIPYPVTYVRASSHLKDPLPHLKGLVTTFCAGLISLSVGLISVLR